MRRCTRGAPVLDAGVTVTERADVLVVGGGPVGVCCALELAAAGARTVSSRGRPTVCPPVSGAHANCGLLVPSDATPLAAPGVLGQGLSWMLDSSSPFYIAPRPSPALARWLWLFRAACSRSGRRRPLPSCGRCTSASARLHDELAAGARRAVALPPRRRAAGVRDRGRPRGGGARTSSGRAPLGARVDEVTAAEAGRLFPGLRCELAGAFFFPEDGHLDPMRFTRAVAGLAADAGATVVTGAEALSLEPARGGVRILTTRGAFDAGQVVLAAGAWTPLLARGSACGCRSSRPRATASTWSGPRTSPRCPSTWASPRRAHAARRHAAPRRHAGAVRVGHARAAASASPICSEGGRRAIGLPADGPVRQLWRGRGPVTPDGLPVIGRVPRP